MSSKKSTTKKEPTKTKRKSRVVSIKDLTLPKDFCWTPNGYAEGDTLPPYPMRRNPEPSPEGEARRLARRKALTLKAARIAYENHHRRKAS
jgi:hypothetical protein